MRWQVGQRGTARELLAQLLQRAESEIVIGHCCQLCGSSRHGQPYLIDFGDPPAISISHAGQWTAVTVKQSPVGTDIELRETDISGLAVFTLGLADVDSLTDPPSAMQSLAILQRWVMKEAVLKAAGVGRSIEIADVVLRRLASHGWLAGSPQLRSRYFVQLLDLAPPLIGAVATLHVKSPGGEGRAH